MDKRYQYWLKILYGPLITVIVFFMRAYKSNRERLDQFMTKRKVTSFFQNAALVILVIWAIIFFVASEESRAKLTQEMKDVFSGLTSFNKE